MIRTLLAAVIALGVTTTAHAQQAPMPYGTPLSFETAKKVLAAAEAEALKNNWQVVITILDSTGHLSQMSRMDNVQYASIRIAEGKAMTALEFRRPSKALADAVAAPGGVARVTIPNTLAVQGGIPLVVDGKIVGACGASGVTSEQDEQICMAAQAALGK